MILKVDQNCHYAKHLIWCGPSHLSLTTLLILKEEKRKNVGFNWCDDDPFTIPFTCTFEREVREDGGNAYLSISGPL